MDNGFAWGHGMRGAELGRDHVEAHLERFAAILLWSSMRKIFANVGTRLGQCQSQGQYGDEASVWLRMRAHLVAVDDQRHVLPSAREARPKELRGEE